MESEWLNSPGPYVQYTYNADPRLVRLIQAFGFAFDDKFWYWCPLCRGKNSRRVLNTSIVKRAPLWTYPTKSVPAWTWARSLARHKVLLVKSPSVFTFGKHHLSLFLFSVKMVFLLNFFSQVVYLTTSSYCKEVFA
jgi:hypothetical protein